MQRTNRIHELMEKAILALPRHRCRRATKKKLAAAAYAMTEVNNTRKKLEKYGMSDVLCLYDAAQFCIMFDADLTVLARDMCCTSDWSESTLWPLTGYDDRRVCRGYSGRFRQTIS